MAYDTVIQKLSPAANSQRNESFNSTVGSKNPKIRFYGGSESSDFRVACGVAQTNAGYGYVCSILEALGIDPGLNCTRYTLQKEKKKKKDCQRKSTIEFKKRRNQLHSNRIHGTARKEKQEGKTYETNIGLNIDLATGSTGPDKKIEEVSHLFDDSISQETLKTYEQTVSPFTPRPESPPMTYDSKLFYNIIIFDTETNTTGKKAELCQLSTIDKSGQNSFSQYILPTNDIDIYASRVNKLSIKFLNGKRTLFKETTALQTLTSDDALSRFIGYLETSISNCKKETTKDICTVLIGHNAKRFDTPIIFRHSCNEVREKLQSLRVWFGDSLSLFDHLVKSKHEALDLSNGQSCPSNESSFYERLFRETFQAHDATEDVVALPKILFVSSLRLSEEEIVSHCKPVSSSDALDDCLYLDKRYTLLQTLRGKLYNEAGNDGAITKHMAEKIAGSGLNFDDLERVFTKFGKKGLFAILSMTPTSNQQTRKSRVTKTPRILSAILTYFEREFTQQ